MAAKTMNTQGFLGQFVRLHENMPDRPFCWVLGSGASVQSGIPSGGSMAAQWLKELHEMYGDPKLSLEQWATADNLEIKGFKFKNAASFIRGFISAVLRTIPMKAMPFWKR
jgi:protein O-mannosyl-transferase